MYWQICSPILWVVFLFCWWSPLLCKSFLIWCSPICLFFLLFPLFREKYLIKFFYEQCPRFCCLWFPFRILMVSGLTLKSLIHSEFTLVCGVRRWSSSIFLHVSVQFSQHHLLSELSLTIVCACFLCQILIDYKTKLWVYFWALYTIPLIDVSVFMPVPGHFDYNSLVV